MCLVPVKEMNMINVYEINHMRTAEMKSNEDLKKSGKHVIIDLTDADRES